MPAAKLMLGIIDTAAAAVNVRANIGNTARRAKSGLSSRSVLADLIVNAKRCAAHRTVSTTAAVPKKASTSPQPVVVAVKATIIQETAEATNALRVQTGQWPSLAQMKPITCLKPHMFMLSPMRIPSYDRPFVQIGQQEIALTVRFFGERSPPVPGGAESGVAGMGVHVLQKNKDFCKLASLHAINGLGVRRYDRKSPAGPLPRWCPRRRRWSDGGAPHRFVGRSRAIRPVPASGSQRHTIPGYGDVSIVGSKEADHTSERRAAE